MSLSQAVELAIDTCIEEGILSDFFRENREKVFRMSLFEFNEELHNKNLWKMAIPQAMKMAIPQVGKMAIPQVMKRVTSRALESLS